MKKSPANILVIDDIPENIKVLGSSLREKGYVVSFATNGGEGLSMAYKNRFDLILLDIMMPGMDGYYVCRQLKSEAQTQNIPVIFITARMDNEDIVQGFAAGAVDYITKPFNAAELLARIDTHIELYRAKQVIQSQAEELTWANKRLLKKNRKLEKALEEIEALRGLLPVCSNCKKVRRSGADIRSPSSWISIESYLHQHTAAEVTHSICPECMVKLYPDLVDRDK